MSRSNLFPAAGKPLFPPVLARVIGDLPVPPSVVRRFDLPAGLRLGELDARAWENFPPASIPSLAGVVLQVTRNSYDEIKRSREPAPIDPSGEGLSVRARNALFRTGLLGTPWLTEVPLGVLASEPGVGAKTLLEWLSAGAAVAGGQLSLTTSDTDEPEIQSKRSPAVHKAAERLRRRRWSKKVQASDPRLGRLVTALCPTAKTAREAAEVLQRGIPQDASPRRVVRQLDNLIAEAESLRRRSLEAELEEVVELLLETSANGTRAVMMRLGLSGQPPTTLAGAGEAARLSRERVRQLEKQLTDSIRDAAPWMPVLEHVSHVLSEHQPFRLDGIQETMQELGLVGSAFSIESILSAARVFGVQIGLTSDAEAGVAFRAGTGVSPSAVAIEAKRLTTHWGTSTVDTLVTELNDRGTGETDPSLIRLLLESMSDVEWLDDDHEWFWVRSAPRNRLLNQAEKIVSVAGSIGLAELRDGVGRHHRMDGFRPPRDVLARLLEQAGLCRRDGGRMIEGPDVRSWEDVLGSTIERTLAEVLFEFGPIMRRDDLERITVEERGVNRSSFYVYLGYSPIIERYAPGVYGLRGAQVTPGEVNALIPPRARTQRLLDHGWTPDGRVWVGYKLSSAALAAGVLSVPAALQEFTAGAYLLFTEHDRPVGTLTIKGGHMWGVGPFYRRWGVEADDFIVVTIDIHARRATIAAGGEELLLRYQEAD